MRLMEFLSDRFKAKILSISVELFERIENKQKKDAPNGWLSDRCAAVPEIVAGVQLWGKRKANQKFLNAVSGLQWSTSENAYGVFISIIYRNTKNEIFWYSDFLEASYWPELKAAQVLYKEMPHFKDWRTEPVPRSSIYRYGRRCTFSRVSPTFSHRDLIRISRLGGFLTSTTTMRGTLTLNSYSRIETNLFEVSPGFTRAISP